MKYRIEIDGLRAVAVIPVILFHGGFRYFDGGFIGVDVFFVISGYLITSLIFKDIQKGTFSVFDFYERRARRLLPALFLVMAVSIPFAWAWLLPRELKDFAQSLIAVSTISSNIFFWRESGYFNPAAELQPLLHTWSLAVEEQFYVLFPMFLMFALRFGERWCLALILLLAALSFALAEWATSNYPRMAFYMLPTRAWELLLGTVVALYLMRSKRVEGSQIFSLIGLTMIIAPIAMFDKHTPFPGVYALVPTVGTALVILFTSPETIVYRILSHKILVGVGLVSYSAYLIHQPVFAFAWVRFDADPGGGPILVLALLSLVLGYFCWRYVERPFRLREAGKAVPTRLAVSAFSLLAACFLVLGAVGHLKDGFEEHYLTHRLTEKQASHVRLINEHTGYNLYDYMYDDGDCVFWGTSVSADLVKRYEGCVEKYTDSVIVIGDSHAMNLFNIVAKSQVHPFVFGIAQGGCRPHRNHSYCHYDAFDEFLDARKDSVELILYHQSGAYFMEGSSSFAFEGEGTYIFRDNVANLVNDYVRKLDRSAPTIWVGPFVEARLNLYRYNPVFDEGFGVNPNSIRIFSELDRDLRSLINRDQEGAQTKYWSLVDALKISTDFLQIGNCITYLDLDHFSRCGEDIIAERIKPILGRMISNSRS